MTIVTHFLHILQQTFAEFQEEYWRKINSSINEDLNLKGIVTNYLDNAEQCHEATLAFAYALHNTSNGKPYMTGVPSTTLNFLSYLDFKENQTLNMVAAQEADLPPGDFTLANFSYVNSVVAERMFHHLKNPGFLGITVVPKFFFINHRVCL